jgi:hypothetical protein
VTCSKISLFALTTKMTVATRAHRQGGLPQETALSCFDTKASEWCQEPSSWVKTSEAVPCLLCMYGKTGFITSDRPRVGMFVSAA